MKTSAKGIISTLILFAFLFSARSACATQKDREVLFQYSTIGALMAGIYDGEMPFGELRKRGNIGIGTVNGLDGELVFLDRKFYQVKSDGKVRVLKSSALTPFAAVTFFDIDKSICVKDSMNMEQLKKLLGTLMLTKNIIYCFKITGTFSYVKTRSVPRQTMPYPILTEAVKNQAVFEFDNIKGTIVGFYFPQYMQEINVADYHMHFIDKSRRSGGHLLECQTKDIKIEVDYTYDLALQLPNNSIFQNTNLTPQETNKDTFAKNQIQQVERSDAPDVATDTLVTSEMSMAKAIEK